MADTRYAFLALDYKMREIGYPKEIMCDFETGHIWIRDKEKGGLKDLGKTKELEDRLNALKLPTGGNEIGVDVEGIDEKILNPVLNLLKKIIDTKIDNVSIGVPGGIAPIGDDGVIPIKFLPKEIKEIILVQDIIERDSVPMANRFIGLNAYVVDATDDPTVNKGGAYYIWDGGKWIKTTETENLDITLTWENIANKPYATLQDAAAGVDNTKIITPYVLKQYMLNYGGGGGGGSQTVFTSGLTEYNVPAAKTINIPSSVYDPKNCMLLVSYDGLDAYKDIDYTISGNTLTFTFTPDSGTNVRIVSLRTSFSYNDLTDTLPIATYDQAKAGTIDNAIMTPIKVKYAINNIKHSYEHTTINNKTFRAAPNTTEKTDIIGMINEVHDELANVNSNVRSHNHNGVYEPAFSKNTAFNKDFGTGSTNVARGNHSHTTYANKDHDHIGVYEPAFSKNTAFNKDFGTGSTDVARGNHSHTTINRKSFEENPNTTEKTDIIGMINEVKTIADTALTLNIETIQTVKGEIYDLDFTKINYAIITFEDRSLFVTKEIILAHGIINSSNEFVWGITKTGTTINMTGGALDLVKYDVYVASTDGDNPNFKIRQYDYQDWIIDTLYLPNQTGNSSSATSSLKVQAMGWFKKSTNNSNLFKLEIPNVDTIDFSEPIITLFKK